jgi:hypothetical protein
MWEATYTLVIPSTWSACQKCSIFFKFEWYRKHELEILCLNTSYCHEEMQNIQKRKYPRTIDLSVKQQAEGLLYG